MRITLQTKTFAPWRQLLAAVCLCLVLSTESRAQDGTNVLVVVNQGAESGERIAEVYTRSRNIPPANVVHLTTAISEEIDRPQYEREIEIPIGAWIARQAAQDRILYIVLIKGIPLRIRGTTGPNGTVASVDSELTLLYRKLLGFVMPSPGRVNNPYFLGSRPLSDARAFSHDAGDIYLVSRLDGFTTADVLALIERGAHPVREGEILLDERAHAFSDTSGDTWLASAAQALESLGYGNRVVLNADRQVLAGRRSVLGYYSWGSNDSAITRRSLDLGFVPGSLAGMFVSTDARTFREPEASWQIGSWADPKSFYAGSPQSLTGDMIRQGVTGVAGHVAEPFLGAAVKPQILFPAYLTGFNLIESFYLSMPFLSWQTVVVGDPLCAPFRGDRSSELRIPGILPSTDLPAFFSERRLAVLARAGVTSPAAEYLAKGETRLVKGDLAGARTALEAATAADESIRAAHLALTTIYETTAEYDLAIAHYQTVLKYAPNDIQSLNNLAYALAVRKGRAAEALPLAEKAYAASGKHPSVADTLGWVHYLLGHQSEAESLLNVAAKGAPNLAEAHVHLAELYAGSARTELAASELKRAIEIEADLRDRADVVKLRLRLGLN
jgi:uncharacterized protein (TIGR03790 family)